ncbi:HK97-gp10 family putative phage morphogenesis protein [Enterococcus italicus]|uniref:HK97-gp10 family putative phage morphogenesis protein n=1 Tax=Enterococcus italicus TaxID=246144 RepID=UPI003F458270
MKINGISALQKKLRDNATLDDVKHVVKSNGTQLNQKAKRLAPVDTGYLKGSITTSVELGGLQSTTTPTASYSIYVEYGTRFMAKQPFLKPAFDTQKKVFLNDLERLMK